MVEWIIFAVLCLLWLLLWIRKLEPTEIAVVKLLFRYTKAVGPGGMYIIPRLPGFGLDKAPTKQLKMELPAVEVYSHGGIYKGKEYSSWPIKVWPVVYLNFPLPGKRDEDGKERLVRVKEAEIPTTEEGLVVHLQRPIQQAVQRATGQMAWKEIIDDLNQVRLNADKCFKEPESALICAGFETDDFNLTMVVELPKELTESFSKPEAALYKAEQRAIETGGAVLNVFCQITGCKKEEVNEFIEKHQDVWQRSWDVVHRRMGLDDRAYFDFRNPDGAGPEAWIALLRKLNVAFGGSSPGEPGGEKVEEKEETEEERQKRQEIEDIKKIGGIHDPEAIERLRKNKRYMELLAEEKAERTGMIKE